MPAPFALTIATAASVRAAQAVHACCRPCRPCRACRACLLPSVPCVPSMPSMQCMSSMLAAVCIVDRTPLSVLAPNRQCARAHSAILSLQPLRASPYPRFLALNSRRARAHSVFLSLQLFAFGCCARCAPEKRPRIAAALERIANSGPHFPPHQCLRVRFRSEIDHALERLGLNCPSHPSAWASAIQRTGVAGSGDRRHGSSARASQILAHGRRGFWRAVA